MKFTKNNLFKTIAIAVIFCMIATTGAFAASTENNKEARLAAFTQLGITDATPMSDSELEEIQGEWAFPGAVVGGFAGAVGYASYTYGSGSAWSWKGFTTATGVGAASGFAYGPVGVTRTIVGWGITGVGSYAGGRWSRR